MYQLEEETEADWWDVEALYDLCFAPGRTALSSYRLRDGVPKVAELCLTLRDGAEELTVEKVREFATGKLAHYKIPRYVMVVDEFPMTVTGKVRKVEMREKSVGMLGLEDAAVVKNA